MNKETLKYILEAGIHAAGKPMSIKALEKLFPEDEAPESSLIKEALDELQQEYELRAVELIEVGSGYRFQVKKDYTPWISRLWEEKPPRYSRALLETLALIAYRQPITRGEIEEIRGVSVSTGIIKTMHEREWIRSVGHRDVPGRPALYATTKEFLDYFNLKSMDELPTLAEIHDLDQMAESLGETVESKAESPQTELQIAISDDAAEDSIAESLSDSTEVSSSIEAGSEEEHSDATAESDEIMAGDVSEELIDTDEDELTEEALLAADTESEVGDVVFEAAALDKMVEELEDAFAKSVTFDDTDTENEAESSFEFDDSAEEAPEQKASVQTMDAAEDSFETMMQEMLESEGEVSVTVSHNAEMETDDADREELIEASAGQDVVEPEANS